MHVGDVESRVSEDMVGVPEGGFEAQKDMGGLEGCLAPKYELLDDLVLCPLMEVVCTFGCTVGS